MALPDEYLNIDTPENVAFGYEVAGIGSRFLAALIDTLILLVLQIVVNLTVLLILSFTILDFIAGESAWGWLVAIFGLVSFAFFWGYYIFFETLWNGQSPGKRMTKLRVIRTDGTPITLAEAIIRNLVRMIDFLPAYYGVGVVVMFIDGQSRRLGDMAAGTLVVREGAAVTLESLAADERRARATAAAVQVVRSEIAELPLERLDSRTITVAEDFLRRRYKLANRQAMAHNVLNLLYSRMEHPAPDTMVAFDHIEDRIVEIIHAAKNRNAG